MPFTLIKGRFKPKVGTPDGDSVRFLADNRTLWGKLEGKPANVSKSGPTKGTVQLRFEGIDAIEKGAIQPLATQAKDRMLQLLGYDRQTNPEPLGYVLARMTDDVSGRPICFAFAGRTNKRDGSEIFLDAVLLRDSVNYQQTAAGFAYPLYYNTLFAALRNEFNQALTTARNAGAGYWPTDQTVTGVTVKRRTDLDTIPPIWPKLWRRLEEFLRNANSLAGFKKFLGKKNERIDVLSEMEERGLQDLVEVQGNTVRLLEPPENLRVVGTAGRRRR